MKKIQENFYSYLNEFDEQDFWIILKPTILGLLSGVIYTSFSLPNTDSFIPKQSAKFNCTYEIIGRHRRVMPICADDLTTAQLIQAAEADRDAFPRGERYIKFALIAAFIGLLVGISRVNTRHHDRRQAVQEQQKTAETSNMDELEQEEKKLSQKYHTQYSQVQAKQKIHPAYLCEPDSLELIGMPPIVCSDGYARGLRQFKSMIESKLPGINGKPLAPFGIMDRLLLVDLLNYVENDERFSSQVTAFTTRQPAKSRLNSALNLLLEILPTLKNTALLVGMTFIASCGLNYLVARIFSPEGDPFSFNKPSRIINNALYLTALISGSIGLYKYPVLNKWFNQKIAEAKDSDTITDVESGIFARISERLFDPFTYNIFEKAVICEDGYTYEHQAVTRFFEGQSTKKSLKNPDFKFKNQYPLLWPYVQRQKEALAEKNKINKNNQVIEEQSRQTLTFPPKHD